MIDIIYRYDPSQPHSIKSPTTSGQAKELLERGNEGFARILETDSVDGHATRIIPIAAQDLGLRPPGETEHPHEPFAIVVGCSDARVPVELVFSQGVNDLFVMRVAGNVLGTEILGSIDFALHNLAESIRLVVVLGHTRCGAVIAATDAFLDAASYLTLSAEHNLRAVVNQILPAVRLSHNAMLTCYGDTVRNNSGLRDALIDTAVVANAGLIATTVAHHVRLAGATNVKVLFGVYYLETRSVGIPGLAGPNPFAHTLIEPPMDGNTFATQTARYAGSPRVRAMLSES